MDNITGMAKLFKYASRYQFEDFEALFSELKETMPPDDFREAYLMRAQIKLFITDLTVLDDLYEAEKANLQIQFPCLGSIWKADVPNRFIVFPKTPGAVQNFLSILPQVRQKMERWYKEQGNIMLRLIHCSILYFMGDLHEALSPVDGTLNAEYNNYTDALLLLCPQFRCSLALGLSEKAEQCMLNMIRLSKSYPECQAPYQAIRSWANITTSWNGDSPRFYKDSFGKNQPILEDRLNMIREGSARTTFFEAPFIKYAQRYYEDLYSIRQYYMDLFHAMYWQAEGDCKQAESYFFILYEIAEASGVIIPFVECGEQVTSLLQHIYDNCESCSQEWIMKISDMAVRYEENLKIYWEEMI